MKLHLFVASVLLLGLCLCVPQGAVAELDFSVNYSSANSLYWYDASPLDTYVESENSLVVTNHGDERYYTFKLIFEDFQAENQSLSTSDNMDVELSMEGETRIVNETDGEFVFTLWLDTGDTFFANPRILRIPNAPVEYLRGEWNLEVVLAGANQAPNVASTHGGSMGIQIIADVFAEVEMVYSPPRMTGQPSVSYGAVNNLDTNVTTFSLTEVEGYYVEARNIGNVNITSIEFIFHNLSNGSNNLSVGDNMAVYLGLASTSPTLVDSNGRAMVNYTEIDPLGLLPGQTARFYFALFQVDVENGTYHGDFNVTLWSDELNHTVEHSKSGHQLSQSIEINVPATEYSLYYTDYSLQETNDTQWILPDIIGGGNFSSENILGIENTGTIMLRNLSYTFQNLSNGVDHTDWTGYVQVEQYSGQNSSISALDQFPIIGYELSLGVELDANDTIHLSLHVDVPPFIPTADYLIFTSPFTVNGTSDYGYKNVSGEIISQGSSDLLEIYYVPSPPDALLFPWYDEDIQASNTMIVLSRHFAPITSLTFEFSDLHNGSDVLDYELYAVVNIDVNPYDLDSTSQQYIFETSNGSVTIENPVSPGVPIMFPLDLFSITWVMLEAPDEYVPAQSYNGTIVPYFTDLLDHQYVVPTERVFVEGQGQGIPEISINPDHFCMDEDEAPISFLTTVTAHNQTYGIYFQKANDSPTQVVNVRVYEELDGQPVNIFYDVADEEILLYNVSEPVTIYVEIQLVEVELDVDREDDVEETIDYSWMFRARRGATVHDSEELTVSIKEKEGGGGPWWFVLLAGTPAYVTYVSWLTYSSATVPAGLLSVAPLVANKRRKYPWLVRYQFHIAYLSLALLFCSMALMAVGFSAWFTLGLLGVAVVGIFASSYSIYVTKRTYNIG